MILITHCNFRIIRTQFGHRSDNTPLDVEAEITIQIPNQFIPFFATSDPPGSIVPNSLENAFLKIIPHLDADTLQEVLRVAAATRLTQQP